MNYNKGFAALPMLLIILGIAVIGGGAYYAGKKSPTRNEVSTTVTTSPEATNTIAASQTVQHTSTPKAAECTVTSPSFIKVISPNGGETFKAGQKITVKWKSCNIASDNINIMVIKHNSSAPYQQKEEAHSDTGLSLRNYNRTNDGSEEVTLPSSMNAVVTSGQYYFISITGLVESARAVTVKDYSDGLFTIDASPSNDVSISGWKTYTNTECGYSFQHPGSWSQWGNAGNSIDRNGAVLSNTIDFMDSASQGIERYDGNNNQIAAAKDFMHVECFTMGNAVYSGELSIYNNSSDIFSQTKKTVTVAGQPAIVGEMRNTSTVSKGEHSGRTIIPSHSMYVFFMHKDQARSLYFKFDTPLGNDATEIANFEQVLKTFKFN